MFNARLDLGGVYLGIEVWSMCLGLCVLEVEEL